LLHIPSVAFSVATDKRGLADFSHTAAFATRLCADVLERGMEHGVLYNVNGPVGKPKGLRVTRQGTRTYRATAEERLDPSGRPYYWIAGVDMTPAGEADGDHVAIDDGYLSLTPLHANLTHEPSLETLAGRAQELTP
jgi:5'-nucleotidase